MLSQEVRSKLDAKIPRDAVATREGGGRSSLSYLEGWYVISRLNEVFGQGNWSYNVEEMRNVFTGTIEGKYGASHATHYIAKVSLTVRTEGGDAAHFSDYGYGDGSDKANPGKAHELAVKEAVTDGVKRCAKNLGMSMGLALYDKTQENVDDGKPAAAKPAAAPAKAAPAPAQRPVTVARPATPAAAPAGAPLPALDAEIKSIVRVVLAKKVKTLDELKTHVRTTYNVESTEQLNDTQKHEVLAFLQGLV